MAKYEATVDVWAVKVQRDRMGRIISEEPEGPIRKHMGQWVYDNPVGKTWVLGLDQAIVVWPDGTMQAWYKNDVEQLLKPVTAKKPRRKTKAVIEDEPDTEIPSDED